MAYFWRYYDAPCVAKMLILEVSEKKEVQRAKRRINQTKIIRLQDNTTSKLEISLIGMFLIK